MDAATQHYIQTTLIEKSKITYSGQTLNRPFQNCQFHDFDQLCGAIMSSFCEFQTNKIGKNHHFVHFRISKL